MGTIYKIENKINHKIYIGKTMLQVEERWKQHLRNVNYEQYQNIVLYKAFKKYGIDNFTFDILKTDISAAKIDYWEKYYIKFYDSYNNGYNMTLGGDGTIKFDYELVQEYYLQTNSVQQTARLVGASEHTIRNIVKELNIYTNSFNRKHFQPIIQLDLHNNILAEFSSIQEAAIKNFGEDEAKTKIQGIRAACDKKQQQAYGFLWHYKGEEYLPYQGQAVQKIQKINKNTGEIIAIYNNAKIAAQENHCDSSGITKVCRGERKTCGGYIWKYIFL